MSAACQEFRERLAARGFRTDDEALVAHLAECTPCSALRETLQELDTELARLPGRDAPDDVVRALLERIEQKGPTPISRPTKRFPLAGSRPWLWSGVVAALLLVVVTLSLPERSRAKREIEALGASTPSGPIAPVRQPESAPSLDKKLRALGYIGDFTPNEGEAGEPVPVIGAEPENVPRNSETFSERVKVMAKSEVVDIEESSTSTKFSDNFASDLPATDRFYEDALTLAPGVQEADGNDNPTLHGSRSRDFQAGIGGVSNADPLTGRTDSRIDPDTIEEMEVITGGAGVEFGRAAGGYAQIDAADRVAPVYPRRAKAKHISATVTLRVSVAADGSVSNVAVLGCDRPGLGFEQAASAAVRRWRYTPARDEAGRPVASQRVETVGFEPEGESTGGGEADDENSRNLQGQPGDVEPARAFLAERSAVEGLDFRPARGYWSNRYLPGDPRLRRLLSSLEASGAAADLHFAARPVAQPFDAPQDSALAVYLHADRPGISATGRALVQVGLQAGLRRAGRRPAMNVALVLDLQGEAPDLVAIGMRSLVRALNAAREPGDRFRLIAAGREPGALVEPEQFRHGMLEVTLDRLFSAPFSAAPFTLDEAVAQAFRAVAADDDPQSPLGASAVILVSGRSLGNETAALVDLAHQGAVAGVPLSVVGVGTDLDVTPLERVALAGQGNLRLLERAAEAPALVDRELASVGRAVARAVRLSIRLAPGVRLVDVVGSRPLDENAAARVREAERSIDLRLASRLGIEADRGDDEDGIQIVIPTFYAGDSHVVLLDVVVPGPGAVAEVAVRFKDLVHLRNGSSRASLRLDDVVRAAGPLELNVLKNLLSARLAQSLENAAEASRTGNGAQAAALLADAGALLRGLQRELPRLRGDAELARDLSLLDRYATWLRAEPGGQQLAWLPDSLLAAARLKSQTRPPEVRS